MGGEFVGTTEVATMLNVSRQRLRQRIDRYQDSPSPVQVIAGRRLWRRPSVESWTAVRPTRAPGRPSDQTPHREEG